MYIILISALWLVHPVLAVDNNETRYAIKDRVCPYASPIKCSGACCKVSQFCGSVVLCESCFPRDIQEPKLLAWCREIGQHNVSSMRSPACRLACQDRYTSAQLVVCEVNDTKITSQGHEEPSTISPTEATPPKESQTVLTEHFHIAIVIGVSLNFVTLLSILVFKLIRWCVKKRRKDQQNTTQTKNTETRPTGPQSTGNTDPASVIEEAEDLQRGRTLNDQAITTDYREPVPESTDTGNRNLDELVHPETPLLPESNV